MKIEVSDGEAADKYSILCLKLDRVQDPDKRRHLALEKDLLHDAITPLIHEWPMYYQMLSHVNSQIWDKTDKIKSCDPSTNPMGFSGLASEIFSHNDQRFRLKRVFQSHSHVQEQKSYAAKTLSVLFPDEPTSHDMARLISLVMDYDSVSVKGNVKCGVWLPPFFLLFGDEKKEIAPIDIRQLSPLDTEIFSIILPYLHM